MNRNDHNELPLDRKTNKVNLFTNSNKQKQLHFFIHGDIFSGTKITGYKFLQGIWI